MARHTISTADQVFYGASQIATYANGQRGIRFHPVTYCDLGAPATIVTTAFIAGATSTEMPNASTKTYTYPIDTLASPIDGAGSLGLTGVLDVPRNIVATQTSSGTTVASTVLITGKDVYGQDMSELLTLAATATTVTATGKKAFKTVTSIAITSAGNCTSDTLNVGFGDTLGLPFFLTTTNNALLLIDNVPQTTVGTLTAAVTTAATTTTGDVRGTWLPNTATNGAHQYGVLLWNVPVSARNRSGSSAYGVAQA